MDDKRLADWSVLDLPGVKTIARKAASKVAADYDELALYDLDDLYQEALILLATGPEVRECLSDPTLGLGVLYTRMVQGLLDRVRVEAARHNRQVSYDATVESEQEATTHRPASSTDTPSGDYSRELIEQLLPAVWDSSVAYGMTNKQAPDPDMPRATIDMSHGCTLYAHLADIKTAWKRSGLSLNEARALLLYYGMGWREREIGENLGAPQQTVSDWITRGVARMRDYLNGVVAAA